MKHSPGCNCCDCTIVGETFTVADGTAIEDVPGWFLADTDCVSLAALGTAAEVQSNVLETASSDFKAVVGIGGVVEDEWIVQSDVKGDDEGDEVEVIAIADGAFRCYLLVVRLTVSDTCPTLQIVYLENTVENPNTETILREIPLPDSAVGEWHRLKACVIDAPAEYPYGGYYNKRIFGSVTTNLGTTRYVLADVLWLSDFGITGVGTGAITTKAYFDNFEMSRHQSETSKSCPRCRVAICEYSTDDFTDGIDCVWDQSYTSPEVFDAPVTAHVSYTTMRGTYPVGGGAPRIRHKIGNPYNHALNSVEVYFLIENEGDTIGIAPIADETGPGPTVFFTAGPEGSDCGYLQMNNTLAVHLPVPAFGANVWVHARVCYGWNYWGTGKILSVVVNEADPTKRVMYSIDVDDYDTDDYNAGIGGGPFWYSALSYAVGTAGNKVYFRDFAVSLSYSADPLLTGTYGYARECQKCYDPLTTCLWAAELCVSVFTDCLVSDSGAWNCADSGLGCGISTVLRGASSSQRIWQLPNPWLQTNQKAEGYVTANGESDQTVLLCYDSDSGDYVGLKFTWDTTCGKVEIIQNGAVITSHESQFFTPGSIFHFCFTHINGFCLAIVRAFLTNDCVYGYSVRLQAELPDAAVGVRCGASTGSWVSPTVVADFHDLIFQTARSETHPECEVCSTCTVLTMPTSEDVLDCEWSGATASTHHVIASGETVSTTFPTFEEADKAVVIVFEFSGFNQSFQINLDGYWIKLETGISGAGRCTTSEGDDVASSQFVDPTTIYPGVQYEFRICIRFGVVRLQLGAAIDGCVVDSELSAPLVSFKRTAGAAWTNTLSMTASGGDVTYCSLMVDYAYTCLKCQTICEACDSYRLPTLAILDVSLNTGTACCDGFEGIHFIDMDGCSGTGDSFETDCLYWGRWHVDIEQFVGYVRITAWLYAQYNYPAPGTVFFWRVNVPTIGPPGPVNGIIDCMTLGRLTLDFDESYTSYLNPCAFDGISFYSGTKVYLELQ